MRLAAAYVPVLCVLFALHGARATSEAPPVVRSTYCDGQGAAERLGFDMGCPAYAIPETLNSEKIPATTCSSIIENYPAAPDGPYWFRHPVTGAVERKWCLFGDGLGPRFDMGRTEITFVTPAGYNTGLTPMSFGSSIDYWTKNATSPMMLRSPKTSPSHRGWVSTTYLGSDAFPTYVATDAFPLRSWAEGALGLLNFNVGLIKFTADAPVVVRMYNVKRFDQVSNWDTTLTTEGWRRREDLQWCHAWCGGHTDTYHGTHWRVYEQFYHTGTHELDTANAAYQFFTPANGILPGSDQPAELESAIAAQPPPTTYRTPRVNVSAPGYAAGLTPYDFGGSVDFWTTNLYLRYPRTDPSDRGWNSFGYIATDADPLPSWSEGALGLLSVDAGTVEFTTDEPVVVRLYNTDQNVDERNEDNHYTDRWTNIDDMKLWRRRNDLAWCNAWQCAPRNEAHNRVGTYWVVWERYFPEGTHALDTTEAAYQFFTPANGTLPGSDQPAELESAAYMDETPGPDYVTPTVSSTDGHTLSQWNNDSTVGTLSVSSDLNPLPSWSEGALGLLSVDVGTVEFTTDEPVVVRLYNTKQNVDDCNRDGGHCNSDRWPNIDDMSLWRRRNELAWCNAWSCAARGEASLVGSYWVVWERYFPEGTHALDTTQAAYQFFTPANGTLPGNDQPADLQSAAAS